MTEDSARHIAALKPTDQKSLDEFRRIVGGAFDVLFGWPRSKPATTSDWQAKSQNECELRLLDIRGDSGEQLPAVLLTPKSWNKRLVIWADGAGKSALFDHSDLRPSVIQLLDAGVAVLGVDLLDQGEFLSDGKPLTKTRRVDNSRDYAGFTFGYNRPLFAERVHDLLTVISMIRDVNGLQGQGAAVSERVYLVGTGAPDQLPPPLEPRQVPTSIAWRSIPGISGSRISGRSMIRISYLERSVWRSRSDSSPLRTERSLDHRRVTESDGLAESRLPRRRG